MILTKTSNYYQPAPDYLCNKSKKTSKPYLELPLWLQTLDNILKWFAIFCSQTTDRHSLVHTRINLLDPPNSTQSLTLIYTNLPKQHMLLQIHIELSLLFRTILGTEIEQWIEPDFSLGGVQSLVLMFSNWNMTKHLDSLIKQ